MSASRSVLRNATKREANASLPEGLTSFKQCFFSQFVLLRLSYLERNRGLAKARQSNLLCLSLVYISANVLPVAIPTGIMKFSRRLLHNMRQGHARGLS